MSAQMGAKVAICEESRVGGTCVIRGCIPKKLLVYGAHFPDDFEDAASYGWTVPEASFDWAKLIAAKDKEIDRLNGIYISILKNNGVELINGRAKMTGPHTVEVAGRKLTAKNILIATGGRPSLPLTPGIEHASTSDDAFDLKKLPGRVAIVGGGYIALEFAGIFQGLGSEVTVIVRGDKLLNGFDDDLRKAVQDEMEKRGVRFLCTTTVEAIARNGAGLKLTTSGNEQLEADFILYATGRHPNTKGLGLDLVGVDLGADGAVLVDDYSRSNLSHIFAVGDVTNRFNLTPVAIAEGAAVARTLFGGNGSVKADHGDIPTAIFSIPPAATVGMTEAEARKKVGAVDIYASSFRPLKFTLTPRQERTFMKLVVDRKTDRVLGCHMVGMDAAEIIQGFAVAVKCGATKAQFDSTVGIHPSAAEEFVTMRDKRPEPTT
jgi:glutathione reductase (NADPH)